MESLPRITILTPTLNQGEYIEESIHSVLNQSYPNLEYIVLDGGSTDQTVEILKKYQDRLFWFSEKDRGQSHAINKGLGMASGEIIAFLNSDDIYEPEALLKVGRYFKAHPEASWLTGRCRTIDANGKEIRKLITAYKNFWLKTRSYQVLLILNYISQPATFWRKKVVDAIGNFDETLRYAMDYDYSLRVGNRFKLWALNDTLASFRIHPVSKAGSSAQSQFISDCQIARRYIRSPFLRWLHSAHNEITVNVYRFLMMLNSLEMRSRNSGERWPGIE